MTGIGMTARQADRTRIVKYDHTHRDHVAAFDVIHDGKFKRFVFFSNFARKILRGKVT
jgi:hypothetical protein